MKKFLLYVIAQIAAIGIISYFLTGFQVRGDVWTYVGLAVVIAIINYFVRPLIKFFTIPLNFLTFGLFNLVFSVAILYLLKIIFPINFGNGEFRSINVENILVLKSIPMNSWSTLIASAFAMSFLSSLIDFLIQKK